MKKIILVILIITKTLIVSDEQHLQIEFLKSFTIGDSYNQFRASNSEYTADGAGSGPSLIKYDESKELFYIVDGLNSRICMYDLQFNQVDEINYSKDHYMETAYDLVLIESGFIFYQETFGLLFISFDGSTIWNVDISTKDFQYELENNNFYYDEKNQIIFFYLKGDDIVALSELSLKMFDYKITYGRVNINNMLASKGIVNIKISDVNKLYVDDKLISSEYNAYFRKDSTEEIEDMSFIGSINNYSYYHYMSNFLLVYDKDGNYIFNKYFDDKGNFYTRTTMPGIHPSGDLLFMTYDKNNIELKRVVNTWAPEIREKWYKEHPGYP